MAHRPSHARRSARRPAPTKAQSIDRLTTSKSVLARFPQHRPITTNAFYNLTKNVLDIPGIHPDWPYYVIWVSRHLGGVLTLTFTDYGKFTSPIKHRHPRDHPPLVGAYRGMLFSYHDGSDYVLSILWPYPWKYSTYGFNQLRKAGKAETRQMPTAVRETIIWYVTHGDDYLPQALADVIQGAPTERPPLRYL